MITLISRWKLRDGAPKELLTALQNLARTVEQNEPETLVYSVHVPAPPPPSSVKEPAAADSLPDHASEVVFFEVYKNQAAYCHHLKGEVFNQFVKENLQYFFENPKEKGRPAADTQFFKRESAFFRPADQ